MWHSFSSSEYNLNSQITVLVLDIAGPGVFSDLFPPFHLFPAVADPVMYLAIYMAATQ